jgi:hypothetical protein
MVEPQHSIALIEAINTSNARLSERQDAAAQEAAGSVGGEPVERLAAAIERSTLEIALALNQLALVIAHRA